MEHSILRHWAKKGLIVLMITIMFLAAFITIFPFLWSALLSTHDRTAIFSTDIILSMGDSLGDNYQRMLEVMPFWSAMFNSLYVAVLGTTVSLLFCSMGGYAFGVYQFKGKSVLFGLLVGSMMVPAVVSIIPYFLIIKYLGLLETHAAIWVPFTATPFCIFMVRQYVVASIPRELLEAAKLDGAGEFRTYWSVVLPLMRPALATVGIVQFVMFWNMFLQPLIALNKTENYVLTLALRSVQGLPNTPWGAVMLGTTLSILPIILVYMFASKQMISGMTSGAVKG